MIFHPIFETIFTDSDIVKFLEKHFHNCIGAEDCIDKFLGLKIQITANLIFAAEV